MSEERTLGLQVVLFLATLGANCAVLWFSVPSGIQGEIPWFAHSTILSLLTHSFARASLLRDPERDGGSAMLYPAIVLPLVLMLLNSVEESPYRRSGYPYFSLLIGVNVIAYLALRRMLPSIEGSRWRPPSA